MRASWLTLALAVGTAAPASAQSDVTRRSFQYLGTDLIIEVHDRSAGALQLLRGTAGRIEVVARAAGGFAEAGLGQNGRLRVSSMGGYRTEYLVIAPENIRIQVQLPDEHLEPTLGTGVTTFSWDALPTSPGGGGGDEKSASQPPSLPAGMVLTYVDAETPRVVGFRDLRSVNSIEVWVGGDYFRVASSVPLSLQARDRSQILVDLGPAPPIDLLFIVPRKADLFGIRVGGNVALAAREGELQTLCTPAVVTTSPDGQMRARLTPVSGGMDCRPTGL
jgi:hypothetical protein